MNNTAKKLNVESKQVHLSEVSKTSEPKQSLLQKILSILGTIFSSKHDLDYETWECLESKPRMRSEFYGRRF